MHNAGMNHWIARLLAFWSLTWHLRQPPLAHADADERARWCRDHAGTFAGRWLGLGAVLWLLFMTPFVAFVPLGIAGVLALAVGMATLTRQILAQRRAGPPPIEPPADFPRRDHDDADDR
ncbi:hypothetical protein BBH56_01455 [Spiribacter roseus]|nr:hypothetical protein BBH56_01455 [Spiribacter roseus]